MQSTAWWHSRSPRKGVGRFSSWWDRCCSILRSAGWSLLGIDQVLITGLEIVPRTFYLSISWSLGQPKCIDLHLAPRNGEFEKWWKEGGESVVESRPSRWSTIIKIPHGRVHPIYPCKVVLSYYSSHKMMEYKFSEVVPISRGTYYILARYVLPTFIHLIGSNKSGVDQKSRMYTSSRKQRHWCSNITMQQVWLDQ